MFFFFILACTNPSITQTDDGLFELSSFRSADVIEAVVDTGFTDLEDLQPQVVRIIHLSPISQTESPTLRLQGERILHVDPEISNGIHTVQIHFN